MTKILFVHNTTMWYRRPFFKRLSEIYDVKFVFTHIRVCKDIYGADISPVERAVSVPIVIICEYLFYCDFRTAMLTRF